MAENGDIEALQKFLDAKIKPNEGFMVQAAYHGRKLLLQYILDSKLLPIDSKDQYQRTALMRAVDGNRCEIVK